MSTSPSELIDAIRCSFIGSEDVYTKGSCYQLYLILKTVFPQAKQWVIDSPLHVVTEIDGKFYDIHGELAISGVNDDGDDGFFVYCEATGRMEDACQSDDESMVDCKRDIYRNLSTWDYEYT